MRTNTKDPPVRRSSSDRTYTIPVVIEHTATDLEQIADEAIQILAMRLADAERERDDLLAATIRMVEAMDVIDRLNDDDGYSLTHDQLVAMNSERDAALEALRAAITD